MKLYHGTNTEFGFIDLKRCPPHRDFGQGFYLTAILKHAQDRAQDKVDAEGGVVTVMEYDFDLEEIMSVNPALKVKRFKCIDEEWARFVMYNRLRKERDPKHEYDIVEGPVADDKMFRQFQRFLSNRIKIQDFVRSLTYRETTHQIAFCSEWAIDLLLDYNDPPRYKIEALISDVTVALMRDRDLSKIDAMNIVYSSNIFAQLSDFKTLLYRKPWQEIYDMLKIELPER